MNGEHVTIPENVVFKKVGEETILLDFEGGVYYGLDPVGSRIWELLAGGRSFAEVVETLAAEYEADAATIEADLRKLVAELESRGLVSR
jgi:hypothetical protein